MLQLISAWLWQLRVVVGEVEPFLLPILVGVNQLVPLYAKYFSAASSHI
jgi:hypothetical protein